MSPQTSAQILIRFLESIYVLMFLYLCSSESESCSVVSCSLQPYGLYSHWNSLGQNTGVGSCSLLWGIFPTQGSNPGRLFCRQILYQLSYLGSPRILEWVAYPFSSIYVLIRIHVFYLCISPPTIYCTVFCVLNVFSIKVFV